MYTYIMACAIAVTGREQCRIEYAKIETAETQSQCGDRVERAAEAFYTHVPGAKIIVASCLSGPTTVGKMISLSRRTANAMGADHYVVNIGTGEIW